MGEARRRKLAGYVPEPKQETIPKQHKVLVIGSGSNSMALLAALMAEYPKLPNEVEESLRQKTPSID